jgi:hypothetical protein
MDAPEEAVTGKARMNTPVFGPDGGRVRLVHVPYVAEEKQGGGWHASALFGPEAAAYGVGSTREDAVADLAADLDALIDECGVPDVIAVCIPFDRTSNAKNGMVAIFTPDRAD